MKSKGLVLRSYGSGNTPQSSEFMNVIKNIVNSGVVILNITQCTVGKMENGLYESNAVLNNLGCYRAFFFVVQRSKTKKYAGELSAEYKELSVAGVRALALMQANTPHRVYAFGTLQVVAPDAQHKPNTLYYPKDLKAT